MYGLTLAERIAYTDVKASTRNGHTTYTYAL